MRYDSITEEAFPDIQSRSIFSQFEFATRSVITSVVQLKPGGAFQKPTLIVLLIAVISSLKTPKALLIRSRAQRNFAYIRADTPQRSTVSDSDF